MKSVFCGVFKSFFPVFIAVLVAQTTIRSWALVMGLTRDCKQEVDTVATSHLQMQEKGEGFPLVFGFNVNDY